MAEAEAVKKFRRDLFMVYHLISWLDVGRASEFKLVLLFTKPNQGYKIAQDRAESMLNAEY